MINIRRSIAWASVGQYSTIVINFLATMLLARLLTPTEFGVSALGGAILGIAEAVRELAGGAFIISERDLTREKIRSTATVNFIVMFIVVVVLLALAEPLSRFFDMPALASYLSIAVFGHMLGTLLTPQQALMSRDMMFDRLAAVSISQTLIWTAVAIALALSGFKANSFAWAGVAAALMATLMCFALRADLSIFRPSLSYWRSVVGFGAYSSMTAVLGKVAEAVPLLIFGKLLSASELAIGYRALLLSLFPERLILAAVGSVVLPELSRRSRDGGDLKGAYLTALSNISVVHWPAMIILALLAQPVVNVVLGHQWVGLVPLVRILNPALIFTVPMMLQFATLVATGGIRILPRLLTLQTIMTAATLSITAGYGLRAAALSMLVIMPINAGMSLLAVRTSIEFHWSELIAILLRSAVVTLAAAVGPFAFWFSYPVEMPLTAAIVAGGLGGTGWLIGLFATRHPFRDEVARAATALSRLAFF